MSAAQTEYGTGPSSTLLAGMIPDLDGGPRAVRSLTNNAKAAQVETLQATGTSYALTMTRGGVSRTFGASGLADATASAVHLKAAIEADGIASGWVSLSRVTDTITATSRGLGTGYDVTYGTETNITLVETVAASDGVSVGFGLAVMHSATAGKGERPTKTTAVAQVWHLTPTVANTTTYSAFVRLSDGRTYAASAVGDGSDTVQEVVELLTPLLNAQLPASTVVVTEDNAKMILTSEVAGTPFTAGAGSNSASAVWTIAESVANVIPDFTRPIAGFAVRSNSVAATPNYAGGDGTPASEYPSGAEMAVMAAGAIVALTDDTVSRFDPVYVRITATGNEKVGSVRNDSDSGDCILLEGARFDQAGTGTAAAHAPVRIFFDVQTLT